MPFRLMCVTALAFALAAVAVRFWPAAPVVRVATRAEMIASHRGDAVVPVSITICLPVGPRAAAEI